MGTRGLADARHHDLGLRVVLLAVRVDARRHADARVHRAQEAGVLPGALGVPDDPGVLIVPARWRCTGRFA